MMTKIVYDRKECGLLSHVEEIIKILAKSYLNRRQCHLAFIEKISDRKECGLLSHVEEITF